MSYDDVDDRTNVNLNREDDLGDSEYVPKMDMDNEPEFNDDVDDCVTKDLNGKDDIKTGNEEWLNAEARVHKFQQESNQALEAGTNDSLPEAVIHGMENE